MTPRRLEGGSFLVTGAAGFIGSHLVDGLLAAGAARVVGVDDLSLGRVENLSRALHDARFALEQRDCSELDGDVAAGFDACFNLAVIPLPASLVRPREVVERNVAMTTSVCELARAGRFGTLVQFSSSEVYGTAAREALADDDPQLPETPYAASKAATDAVAASYHRTFGVDVVVVRPFNTYGPRQNQGSYAGLIPAVLARLDEAEPVLVHGDGDQTRDYVFVEDTVRGALAAYARLTGDGRAVNVGSGREISVNEVVQAILEAAGAPDHPVVHGPERPGDVRRQRADIARARTELGFEPRVDFAEGMRRTVASYR
ncbi:MAG: GDP-mannose 4,6-dehydratase [Actinomycetota bacterium]|nr:GDP-mannose 4,6-dehydratase [Actinomycetota bacterium]